MLRRNTDSNLTSLLREEDLCLNIRIIGGVHLPVKKLSKILTTGFNGEGHTTENDVHPFVEISIIGFDSDNHTVKTKTVKTNNFNPIWNETFKLDVSFPSLAFLRVAVFDRDASFIG